MRPEYYLPDGLVKKFYDKKERTGLFNFSKLLKKLFTRFKVAHVDDCCELPEDEQTDLPVRYNAVTEQLEYYNPTTKEWTAAS